MSDGNLVDGIGRCHGIEIRRLTSGYTVTVYGPSESQREGPDTFASVAVSGNYRKAVETAIEFMRECLLLEPKEAS